MAETSEPQTKAYHSDGTVCPGECDWQKRSHAFKTLAAEHNLTPEQLDAIVTETAEKLAYRAAQYLNGN